MCFQMLPKLPVAGKVAIACRNQLDSFIVVDATLTRDRQTDRQTERHRTCRASIGSCGKDRDETNGVTCDGDASSMHVESCTQIILTESCSLPLAACYHRHSEV